MAIKPKVLFFDIEVLSSMDADCGSVCSFAYKYWGEKRVHCFAVSDYTTYEDDIFDDSELLKDIHHIISEADMIVGHNSKGFDLKYLNTRFIINDMPAIRHKSHVDTYHDIARHHLKVRSRKLGNIAKLLGCEQRKGFMDFPKDWNAVIVKRRGAMAKMIKYNKQDVIVLEEIYDRLCQLLPNPPHLGLMSGHPKDAWSCPFCASLKTKVQSYYTTLAGRQCVRHCNDCGRNWKAESALTKKKGK